MKIELAVKKAKETKGKMWSARCIIKRMKETEEKVPAGWDPNQ